MKLTVARIIWGSIVMTTLAFAGMPFVVPPQVTSPPPLLVPFAVLCLGLALGSVLVPRIILRRTLRARGFATVDAPAPTSPERLFRDAPPTRRVFSQPEQVLEVATRIYLAPIILGVALAEAISTFGLVLHLAGYPRMQVVPFFGAGTVLALLRFPSERHLIAVLEATYAAHLERDDRNADRD